LALFKSILKSPSEQLSSLEFLLTAKSGFNRTDKNEIPVPATFIIDKGGIIRFTFAHGDYTKRIEPQQVLDVLSKINSK